MEEEPIGSRCSSKLYSVFPVRSLLLLFSMVGGIVGLGSFTVYYARGLSYLMDDPQACANCHAAEAPLLIEQMG